MERRAMAWNSDRFYWNMLWIIVMAVTVTAFIVWFVNHRTDVGTHTASNIPAVTDPAANPQSLPAPIR
jgi:predicted ABC-type sugar transport system permease subunit